MNTPWARQLQGQRVQLPIRTGMLYRIMLGATATGQKKKAAQQQRLLCLSLVEKKSIFGAGITDTRGGKTNDGQRWDTEVEEYYDKLYNVKDSGKPLEMTDFEWVFSTPQLTRSYAFAEIYCHETDGKYRWADEHPWNNGTGELLPKYFAGTDFTWDLRFFDGLHALAALQIAELKLPSVTTVVGQAKRLQVDARGSSSASRKKRPGSGASHSSLGPSRAKKPRKSSGTHGHHDESDNSWNTGDESEEEQESSYSVRDLSE